MSPPFSHRLRVRYAECDPQGVVFNAHYFTYFDIAMTELWREALGSYDEMLRAGTDMVVAEASARYLAAASFDEEVDVEATVTRLGTTGMTTRLIVRGPSAVGAVEGGEDGAAPELAQEAGARGDGAGPAPGGGDTAVLVEGQLRHVFIDPTTRRKKPIPARVRRELERYAGQPAANPPPPAEPPLRRA